MAAERLDFITGAAAEGRKEGGLLWRMPQFHMLSSFRAIQGPSADRHMCLLFAVRNHGLVTSSRHEHMV